jgi:hypothetical protein
MNAANVLSSASKCRQKFVRILLVVASLASPSFGQTSPGKLTYSETTTPNKTCGNGYTDAWVWTFTDSLGGNTPFRGVPNSK